jgi:hypothetical protein
MNYFINPWYFYFANLADNISTTAIALFVVSIIAAIGFGTAWGVFAADSYDSKTINFLSKCFKKSIIAVIVSSVIMCVVPSGNTINKMMIASYVTKENVETAKDDAKALVDYIVEKAVELKSASSEK